MINGTSTRYFRLFTAQQFKESFEETQETKFYLGVGREFAWDDDNNPPQPVDTVANTNYGFWQSLYAAKKILPKNASFVVLRNDWQSNTIYQEYRSNRNDFYDSNFFVLTDERNVYKCLFNNNDNPSTIKPTGTSTSNINTADGYVWKYMYSVGADKALKFLTQNYMPVEILESDNGTAQWQVQQAASNGAIEIIDVVTTGENYLQQKGTLSAVSNGTHMKLSSNANGSDNIYNYSALYIDSGKGAGQVSQIIDYIGSTRQVVLKNAFTTTPNTSSTYSVTPYIKISGDGSDASAYANVSAGGVTKVTMIDGGSDYAYPEVSVVANNSHGSGAKVIPHVSPKGGHGANAFSELLGHNILLNVKFDGNEANTIPTNTEFRTVSVITNPLNANGTIANNVNYDLTTTLNLSSLNGHFQSGEFVKGDVSGTEARVMYFANTTQFSGFIRSTHLINKFEPVEQITGNTSGTTAQLDTIDIPELRLRQGNIIYQQNHVPVKRDNEQTEDVKLIIKF